MSSFLIKSWGPKPRMHCPSARAGIKGKRSKGPQQVAVKSQYRHLSGSLLELRYIKLHQARDLPKPSPNLRANELFLVAHANSPIVPIPDSSMAKNIEFPPSLFFLRVHSLVPSTRNCVGCGDPLIASFDLCFWYQQKVPAD